MGGGPDIGLPQHSSRARICMSFRISRWNQMTKEEMQRFLIKESKRGSTEIDAYRNLMDILGIEFPKEPQKEEGQSDQSARKV